MARGKERFTILLADDDPAYCLLLEAAFKESQVQGEFKAVENGGALLEHLRARGKRRGGERSFPFPSLILLDLNMPGKSGLDVLKEIKSDPKLKCIPVVVLTTSRAQEDIDRSYALGASSFVSKPDSFERAIHMFKCFRMYWFDTVELPALGA